VTFQTIINSAQSIEFKRNRVVAQSISRSQRIKTTERVSAQPFVLTVTPQARFRFSETRTTLELIQNFDRNDECEVKLGSTANLRYLTDYMGSLSSAQRTALTITNATLTSITVGGLPSVSSSTVIFRAGDWIQPTLSRYPYIVTGDVLRGSGSVITATTHRPIISSEGISLTGSLRVGTDTTLVVIASQFPTYAVVERDWAEYRGDFEFVERVI
jgi:hypothetical protein